MSRAIVSQNSSETDEPVRKRKGGRPSHVPSEKNGERIRKLVAFGHPAEEIALLLDITVYTLNKYYARDLAIGRIEANEKVANCLFDEATSGRGRERVRAQEFWLKNRAGWKDQKATEISGPNGGPVPTNISIEFVESTISDGDE